MARLPVIVYVLQLTLVLLATTSLLPVQSQQYGMRKIWNARLLDGLEADHADIEANIAANQIGHRRQRRVLLQETSDNNTNGRPLAVKDGRLDPFDGFDKYRGGYDVESKHYWGSVAFTGIFGYALAAAWLLTGLILGFYLCCIGCRGRKRQTHSDFQADPPHAVYFWLAVLGVVLLTGAAIGSSVAVYVGNRNFTVEARNVEDTLTGAANNATDTIGNVTTAITEVQKLLEPFTNEGSTTEIVNTKARLANESANIQNTVNDNTDTFDKIVTITEAAVIVVTTLNLLCVVMGPVCAVLNRRRIFYFIVVTTWILTILTSFVFGVYFMFNNAIEDTCDAMNEYMEQPYNTTLDALLPCEELSSVSDTVTDIAKEIRNSISSINETLNLLQKALPSGTLKPICEQIGPPPNYESISTCPENTVTIGDLPQELEPLRCSTNDTTSCFQQSKFLTDGDYQKVMAYATSGQILLNIYPTVNRLTDCSLIVHAFQDLLNHNCSPARSALRLMWIAFLVLAVSMICLIVSWLLLTYRSRERKLWRIVAPQDMPQWTNQLHMKSPRK